MRLRRALIISDPGAGSDDGLLEAQREGLTVAGILKDKRVPFDLLSGATPAGAATGADGPATLGNVLLHLLEGSYDLVHYAGHGSFSGDDPQQGSGWHLADRMLQARHLRMIERLPALLVSNACHSSRMSTGFPAWLTSSSAAA